MKGLKLLFTVCLAPLAFHGAIADDGNDAVRAAVRRTQNTTASVSRQKPSSDNTQSASATNTQSSATISRTVNLSAKQSTSSDTKARTGISPRNGTIISDTERNTPQTSVAHTTTTSATKTRVSATSDTNKIRTTVPRTTQSRVIQPATRNITNSTSASRPTVSRAITHNIARVATDTDTVTAARDRIMSGNAKSCRDVYYSCMDEFCANKDATLKRCACSSRIHEFDSVKKNLANVEEKMLDFNQRLLTVNMDKEDAEALYKATEGELAFNQKDTSASKKMLDEIAKKLNTSFDDNNFNTSLSPISLSLNMDAAFDSVDSLRGASTTTKNGTDLYAAALPICREMGQEVCTDDELTIAESGYQMQIEQDCNTVAKSYQAQTDAARERVREGSALLDMSRLDIHQKRNSDDILTCKRKMLDMLTNSSVCGSDMGKCLDVSGRYIDPSTGEAFLSIDLANLGNLITRPTDNQSWTTAPNNAVFVSFLNSKKKFIEPAMENCQDIADTVWNEFLDDALAQIKLAQESKLEDVRQSCTTLTTQCLSDASQTIADFDARALSIFGVKADKTVTAMCADITNACSALLNQNFGTSDDSWIGGMTGISNTKTYETILQTCREVGRACIIQVCTSISGNFGLCENIQTSINRKSIINRTACWDEVYNCVAEAGTDKIHNIMEQLGKIGDDKTIGNFYEELYNITSPRTTNCTAADVSGCIYDMCATECENVASDASAVPDCEICRITEQIWGNCEDAPDAILSDTDSHNEILIPTAGNTTTLLSWFAKNTGTLNSSQSCRDTSCPPGQMYVAGQSETSHYCTSASTVSVGNKDCGAENSVYYPYEGVRNCCTEYTIKHDQWGNCIPSAPTPLPTKPIFGLITSGQKVYLSQSTFTLVAKWTLEETTDEYPYPVGDYALICVGANSVGGTGAATDGYPNGDTITCNGTFVVVNLTDGYYFTPSKPDAQTNIVEEANTSKTTCSYTLSTGTWQDTNGTNCDTPNNWKVSY